MDKEMKPPVNGISKSWMIGVLTTVVLGGAGYLYAGLQGQVNETQRDQKASSEKIGTIEEKAKGLEKSVDRIEKIQEKTLDKIDKLDEYLRRQRR